MADQDQLQRFLFENTSIRGEYVHLDSTFQAALARHDYPPVVSNVLGQAMAAAVLLGATIKFEGSLIFQLQGKGPVSLLVVQLFSNGSLRGLANWNDNDLPDTDHLATLFGEGHLVITIEAKPARGSARESMRSERYQGIVALGNGNIAEALEGYFIQSEQLKTRLWLTVSDNRAAGLLIQAMPGSRKNSSSDIDEEHWNRISHLSDTITPEEMIDLPFRKLLYRLFHEEDVRVFESEIINFRCSCTRERIENLLRGIGQEEVRSILEEQGGIEVDCEYCKQHYSFDAIDAESIFLKEVSQDVPRTKH